MKTNFEKNIKNQLQNREIDVSENAWERLNEMMKDEQSTEKKKYKLWIPMSIAASLAIIFGTFWWMNQSNQQIPEEILQPNIVQISNDEISNDSVEKSIDRIDKNKITEEIATTEFEIQKNKVEIEPITEKIVANQEVSVETNMELNDSMTFQENPSEWAQVDVSEEKEVEKKYVNPEMLLYSIENNQVIQEVQTNRSRMVIVDFNK